MRLHQYSTSLENTPPPTFSLWYFSKDARAVWTAGGTECLSRPPPPPQPARAISPDHRAARNRARAPSSQYTMHHLLPPQPAAFMAPRGAQPPYCCTPLRAATPSTSTKHHFGMCGVIGSFIPHHHQQASTTFCSYLLSVTASAKGRGESSMESSKLVSILLVAALLEKDCWEGREGAHREVEVGAMC